MIIVYILVVFGCLLGLIGSTYWLVKSLVQFILQSFNTQNQNTISNMAEWGATLLKMYIGPEKEPTKIEDLDTATLTRIVQERLQQYDADAEIPDPTDHYILDPITSVNRAAMIRPGEPIIPGEGVPTMLGGPDEYNDSDMYRHFAEQEGADDGPNLAGEMIE